MSDVIVRVPKHLDHCLRIIWRVSFIISLSTAVVMGCTADAGFLWNKDALLGE
jgi:hypothetical protein